MNALTQMWGRLRLRTRRRRGPSSGDQPLLIGQRVGSYRVVQRFKSGGMACLYQAVHEHIEGKQAIIKVLLPRSLKNLEIVERFAVEARATTLASARTQGVVNIYDQCRIEGPGLCLIMEQLQGQSLRERMSAPSGGPDAHHLRLFRHLTTTLGAVHDAGLVHRDVTPANVIIVCDEAVEGHERPKLIDFGIAKLPETSLHTRFGRSIGTDEYMAPEQIGRADSVTGKADIYALGVMLYQLCAGDLPFKGPDHGSDKLYREPQPLAQRAQGLPAPLTSLVDAMLRRDPQDRPSIRTIEEALDLVIEALSIGGVERMEMQPYQGAPGGTEMLVAQPTQVLHGDGAGDSRGWYAVPAVLVIALLVGLSLMPHVEAGPPPDMQATSALARDAEDMGFSIPATPPDAGLAPDAEGSARHADTQPTEKTRQPARRPPNKRRPTPPDLRPYSPESST